MTPDEDIDFGGEPSETFESLPPKAEQAPAEEPGDEIELAYIGAVIGDADGFIYAKGRSLPAAAFQNSEARKIWKALQNGASPSDPATLMRLSGLSVNRLGELLSLDSFGLKAAMNLAELWQRHRMRLKKRISQVIADANELEPEEWKRMIDGLSSGEESLTPSRPLSSYEIPPDGDKSILLGNRFLNRGDGGVLVSTSGVGKSSMSLQAAVCWALGRPFMGIKPNGPLKSLIIQSEDSDGDVAEVWVSIAHSMKLTEEEKAAVSRMVIIITDRTHRGLAFLSNLRLLIAKHNPDIGWLNPLQAFIDGDITDSRDLGAFLREGINSLCTNMGVIVVHHTTKPSQDAKERQAHEIMYDMSGGAEIINWARFIMSLRACEEEGKFNLVLAKRGRRAGVTKMVEQGAGMREEIVTTIPLQHAREQIEVAGRKGKLNLIYWLPSEHNPKPVKVAKSKGEMTVMLEKIIPVFRVSQEKAVTLNLASRAIMSIAPMQKQKLQAIIEEGLERGVLKKTGTELEPAYYAV